MSIKDEERWKRLAALGAKREIPTPEGEARMSAVILQLAEPIIKQHGRTVERAKSIIMLTIAGWNKSMFPPDKQPIVEKELIDHFVPKDGSAEVVGVTVHIMDMVADKREELFPDLRKIIVDYEVEIIGDRLTLNVTSAPIPDLSSLPPKTDGLSKHEAAGDSQGQESTGQQQAARFAIGDHVRVKHGVVDVDYADLPLGGWAGTISMIDKDGMCLLRWNGETLESIHPVYRKRCERDGANYEEYWLKMDDIEPDSGGPLSIEQPTNIITRPLSMDDQDDRIRTVFGLTSDDPPPTRNNGTELAYFNYLKANLSFPFAARYRDRIEGRTHDITVFSMADEFPVDERFGVMCEGREEEEEGQEGEVPLSELELGQDYPGFQLVSDYLFWFAHAPEAVEKHGDEDSEEEEVENEDRDEESEGEEVTDEFQKPPPPPTRQKAGRNDPCPCGSGRKFKKCCLKKQNGSSFVD